MFFNSFSPLFFKAEVFKSQRLVRFGMEYEANPVRSGSITELNVEGSKLSKPPVFPTSQLPSSVPPISCPRVRYWPPFKPLDMEYSGSRGLFQSVSVYSKNG